MNQIKCTQCGTVGLEPGIIEDTGQYSHGFARWVAHTARRGMFGGVKHGQHWQIDAFRCPTCNHLELFVQPEASA